LAFRIENYGDGVAVSLPNYHNNLALAALVPSETAITAMCFDIGGLHVAAEIAAIDLRLLAFTADDAALRRTNVSIAGTAGKPRTPASG
jgi:hypothetical protein